MFKKIVSGAAAFACFSLLLPASSSAAIIEYDISGTTRAPLGKAVNGSKNFIVDWENITLSYDDKGTSSLGDDLISLGGTFDACFGNSECRGDDPFAGYVKYKPKRYYLAGIQGDRGTYDINASFGVNENLSDGADSFYADEGDIGNATMTEQESISKGFRKYLKVGHSATNLGLGLKEHPDLGWAFRLFDDGVPGDGIFRIETWLVMDGLLLNGAVRHETRVIEQVFNGSLMATRIGGTSTEVPEPATSVLLLTGLAGLARKRRKSKQDV